MWIHYRHTVSLTQAVSLLHITTIVVVWVLHVCSNTLTVFASLSPNNKQLIYLHFSIIVSLKERDNDGQAL